MSIETPLHFILLGHPEKSCLLQLLGLKTGKDTYKGKFVAIFK